MRSMLWRNRPPGTRKAPSVAMLTRKARRSQSSWNTGSDGGASTGPKPSSPPTSWTPSMRFVLLQIGNRAPRRLVGMATALDRVASDFQPPEAVVVDAHDHVAGAYLRMREHRGDVVDRPARQVGGLEPFEPRVHRCMLQRVFQRVLHLGVVLGAEVVGGEARIVRNFGTTEDRAQLAEQRVVARGDDDVTVGRGEGAEGRDRRMAGAEGARARAGGGVAGDCVLEDRDLAVEHRHVDLGGFARALAVVEGGADTDGGEQPRREIADRRADSRGWAVGLSGDAHHTAHGLHDHVVGGAGRERAGVTEPGDGGVDESWEAGMQLIPSVAETLHRPRTEVLDEHVGIGEQGLERFSVGWGLEVERA